MQLEEEIRNIEQILLEERYSKKYIRDSIIKDIKNTPELEFFFNLAIDYFLQYVNKDYYESKNTRIRNLKQLIQPNELIAEIFINVLPISQVTPIQGVATTLAKAIGYDNTLEGIKTVSEVLVIISLTKLFHVYRPNTVDNEYISIQSNVRLSTDTLTFIEQTKFLPPIINKPKEIKHNANSAYTTINKSVILGKSNHHNYKQALDVLNILNNIQFSLDESILQLEEEPNKPLDTVEKVNQFLVLKEASREVYEEMVNLGNKFYFDHRFDKRGRIYMQGYHINLQSTSYKKALMNFSNKVLINKE